MTPGLADIKPSVAVTLAYLGLAAISFLRNLLPRPAVLETIRGIATKLPLVWLDKWHPTVLHPGLLLLG